MNNKPLRIMALLAAMVVAPIVAGRVHFESLALDLLASAAIGVVAGLLVLFIFKRLPVDDRKDKHE